MQNFLMKVFKNFTLHRAYVCVYVRLCVTTHTYIYTYLCISSKIIIKNVHDIQTAVFHFACGDTQTTRFMAL